MEKQQECAQDISWEKRLQGAVNDMVREMSRDKSEGSYYYSWQANIAMAFHDEFAKMMESGEIEAKFKNSFTFHDCCNNAAKRFLDQLCHEGHATLKPDESLAEKDSDTIDKLKNDVAGLQAENKALVEEIQNWKDELKDQAREHRSNR